MCLVKWCKKGVLLADLDVLDLVNRFQMQGCCQRQAHSRRDEFVHGLLTEVTAAHLPFLMHIDEHSPGQALQRGDVREDADHVGATLDLAAADLPMLRRSRGLVE